MLTFSRTIAYLIFLFAPPSSGTTFTPNCTLPLTSVTIVSSSNIRGTWDLFWSSIFTLLLCTWSVQHLNIPQQKNEKPTSILGKLKGVVKENIPKVRWMILILVFPELLVGHAFQDWVLARRAFVELGAQAEEDGVEWTLTHAFFANMAGFVVKVKLVIEEGEEKTIPDVPVAVPLQIPSTTIGDITSVSDGKKDQDALLPISVVKLVPNVSTPSPTSQKLLLYLNASQLQLIRSFEVISSLPSCTKEQIKDKSKGDFVIKGLAVFQMVWLLIQTIARAVMSLPISQLEIAVLAFCLCASLAYFFLWGKPQDVRVPITIIAQTSITQPQLDALNLLSNRIFLKGRTLRDVRRHIAEPPIYPILAVKTFFNREYYYRDIALMLTGALFGAPHLLAWDFAFPSSAEATLWRISSVICVTGPVFFYGVFVLRGYLEWRFPNMKGDDSTVLHLVVERDTLTKGSWHRKVLMVADLFWNNVSWVSYVFARLFLMAEIFRSLFCLPPGAFVTTF